MEIYLCCNIFYSVNFNHQTFILDFQLFERLFLAVPQGCLQFVIVVFPDHTHLLFLKFKFVYILAQSYVLHNGSLGPVVNILAIFSNANILKK